MDPENIKAILKKHGLRPNFTYGQNFLIDEAVLQTIVDAATLSEQDAVLEIGPGVGNLTRLLCRRAGLVLGVEKDGKFLPLLKSVKKDFPKNFYYEIADVLQFHFQEFFFKRHYKSYKVVANIPYFITGKILRMLLTAQQKPKAIVMLVQKEVAQTLTAKPGDLSILAISVQLYGEVKILEIVPAKSFYPAPKVDSAVVSIQVLPKPRYHLVDEKKFFSVLRACFAGKRKQIHNTLRSNLGLSKEQVGELLSDLQISPAARPQELGLETWVSLANRLAD